jgi:hypothetical protein
MRSAPGLMPSIAVFSLVSNWFLVTMILLVAMRPAKVEEGRWTSRVAGAPAYLVELVGQAGANSVVSKAVRPSCSLRVASWDNGNKGG